MEYSFLFMKTHATASYKAYLYINIYFPIYRSPKKELFQVKVTSFLSKPSRQIEGVEAWLHSF
jgi:hypothetical protein